MGLDFARDTTDWSVLGAYDHHIVPRGDFLNVEHHTVFRGRLRPEALARLRFPDGEVAAVCLIAVPELARYLAAFPDRVASGLGGSFPLYRSARASKP